MTQDGAMMKYTAGLLRRSLTSPRGPRPLLLPPGGLLAGTQIVEASLKSGKRISLSNF